MALKGIKIVGDNKWRNILYGYELPKKWRKEFDWIKSDEEYDTSVFVKLPGKRVRYYALSEMMVAPKEFKDIGWDGYLNDTYFSGILIKVSSDGDRYKIGTFYSK